MPRITVTLMLALTATLAVGTAARADDNGQKKNGFSGGPISGSTMTLGGKGTPAEATKAGDSELTWYHGYRGAYWRGYYAGYYGYTGFYAGYPVVASYYAAPAVVTSTFVTPTVVTPTLVAPYYSVGYYSPFFARVGPFGRVRGIAVGVGGVATDVVAPAIPLSGAVAPAAQPAIPATQLPAQSVQPAIPSVQSSKPGTTIPSPMPQLRYDGGPNNPVPIPKADPNNPNGQAIPPLPPETGLPVSLPKGQAKPAKPYAYKGYGEK
jgi:hypothetical protein